MNKKILQCGISVKVIFDFYKERSFNSCGILSGFKIQKHRKAVEHPP